MQTLGELIRDLTCRTNPMSKSEVRRRIEELLRGVTNIELAPDEKTIKQVEKLSNNAIVFGYAQGWMCNKLEQNIKDYLKK